MLPPPRLGAVLNDGDMSVAEIKPIAIIAVIDSVLPWILGEEAFFQQFLFVTTFQFF